MSEKRQDHQSDTRDCNPGGLSSREAHRRLEQYGQNVIAKTKHISGIQAYLARFKNPLVLILLLAAGISFFMGEIASGTIITVIILISTSLDFANTYRSEKAVSDLERSVHTKATVLRDGKPRQLDVACLVPGDVVTVQAGSVIPADGKVISSNSLLVDASSLTGESYPVAKQAGDQIYMGSIVAPDSRSADGIQRYKELNRARTVAFDGVRFLRDTLQKQPAFDVYPASTGIGMGGEDVALSCSALLTERKDVFTLPLENPRQTPAFDYARHYSPETPKFARAMAVVYDNQAAVYISGTASITASETQHIGNTAKQTEETLLNIATLISAENFANAGFAGFGAKLTDLAVVRAYVKHAADYEIVRRECEKQLPGVPVVYTVGDVCRDDLLVELEAVAHIRRQ